MVLAADRSLLLGSMHMSCCQQGRLTAAPTGFTPGVMGAACCGHPALAHCTHLLMGNRATAGTPLSAPEAAGSASPTPVAASGAAALSATCTAGQRPGTWPPDTVNTLGAAQIDWTAVLTCSVKALLSFRALFLHTGHRGRRLLSHWSMHSCMGHISILVDVYSTQQWAPQQGWPCNTGRGMVKRLMQAAY